MPLFGKGEEKIYHIDQLNEHMRRVIKTIMDVNMADVAKYYGLKYLTPKWGEPIFIPLGRLNGKFKKFEEAFDRLYEEIDKVKGDGLKLYSQWYPNSQFLNHYRIVFYSFTQEEVVYGIGAEPLAITETHYLLPQLSSSDITVIGMQLSPLALLSNFKMKFYDFLYDRRQEIIDSYNWLYTQFHAKYDFKDPQFVTEISTYYMNKFFENVDASVRKRVELTNALKGDVAIMPMVDSIAKKDGKIIDIWNSDFASLLEQGNYYKVEAVPAIYNEEFVNEMLNKLANNFNKVVLLFEKKIKVPNIQGLKVEKQGVNFVILSK